MSDFTLILNRNPSTPEAKQTIGKMLVFEDLKQVFECFTLELPWKNNTKKTSCIKAGEYDCIKRDKTAAIPYQHILIKEVEGRDGICIHKANYYSQLRGCIAVGDKHIDINKDGEFDVTNSGKTFEKMMELLPDNFKLIIN